MKKSNLTNKPQRIVVSGFVFHKGKCLILQRGKNESFSPGYWENPGGKLEYGEDPLEGLKREVKEEAGIDCEVKNIYHVWHWISTHKEKETHFVEIAFIVKPLSSKIVIEHKMDDYRWITEKEIEQFKMTPQMKEEIRKGFKWIKEKIK